MERNVCLLINDLFSNGGCDNTCDLIICEFRTFKTIIHTKFNQFLFNDYFKLKNYELISWNSSVYWNDNFQMRCSSIVLYVKEKDNFKEVKKYEIN